MPRYFLELAYKGTAYSGFQVQQNAPTIQQEVEKALAIIFRRQFGLTGSSRTDAGVHALQNFFHFDTELSIHPGQVYNLNAVLPADISVKGIYPVADNAHCRFDAVSRAYKYFIYNKKNPFLADRGWMYPFPVNTDLMQEAARLVKGHADFTSFSKRNTQVKTFLCEVIESEWYEEDDMLVYRIKANRFLRGMVRGLVGTMLKLGRGQLTIPGFEAILESKDCTKADFTTPAHGLFLIAVQYPPRLELIVNQPIEHST